MISYQESHLKHQLVPGIDFDLVGISLLCTVLDVFTVSISKNGVVGIMKKESLNPL